MYLNKRNIDNYWNEIKKAQKNFLIEKFLEGQQYSLEAIVHNTNVKVFPLSLRNYKTTKYLYPNIIEDGGEMPLLCKKKFGNDIKIIIQKLVKFLDYKNGALKFDLVMDKNNNINVIEFATRTSGGYLSTYDIQKVTGINYYELYF